MRMRRRGRFRVRRRKTFSRRRRSFKRRGSAGRLRIGFRM